MDRALYKSHALTPKLMTSKILLGVKAGYYKHICSFLVDCSDHICLGSAMPLYFDSLSRRSLLPKMIV